jgi:hypothetical protein
VDADHDQSSILVLLGPGADVGERAKPIDAGVRPEVDEDDLSPEVVRRERRRVEPAGRPVESGEMALSGERSVAAQIEDTQIAPPRFSGFAELNRLPR